MTNFIATKKLILLLTCFCCVNLSFADEANYRIRNLSDSAEVKRQSDVFEHSLASIGLKTELQCSMMIELSQGIRDRSYGAFCDLQGSMPHRTIMVCDDIMIGKLTIKSYGFSLDEGELIEFTKLNCPNGG